MTQPQYLPPTQYYVPPPAPLPPQPPNHTVRNRIGIVLAFVLAGVTLIGVPLAGMQLFNTSVDTLTSRETPKLPTVFPASKFTVSGTVSAEASEYVSDSSGGDLCYTDSDGGYSDIEAGAQIEVQNGEGATIALGTLAPGVKDGADCDFGFTISDIPEGESIYSFRAGNSIRGGMKYTRQQLKDDDDTIALGFG